MTFATLINGYALNTTVRLTFCEPERVVGKAQARGAEPKKTVFVSGSVHSQATSTIEGTRTAVALPDTCTAHAVIEATDAGRILSVKASGVYSKADATGQFTRLAYGVLNPVIAKATVGSFEPTRLARLTTGYVTLDQTLNGSALGQSNWYKEQPAGTAETGVSSTVLTTRLVTPTVVKAESKADVLPLTYDLTRWMAPKQARNRAISYVKEGSIFRLKVNQQYVQSTAIARASSRGTPNTTLAFSIGYATSTAFLHQANVVITRASQPMSARAEALASGVTAQDHAIRGQAVGTASAHIAPDITTGGVRYAYMQGNKTGSASLSTVTAVRWPMVRGIRQPASADLKVSQLIARDMRGSVLANGASVSDPEEAIITHTVWATGQTRGKASELVFEPTVLRKVTGYANIEAVASGVPWHWIAIPADGVAQAKAHINSQNPRITRPFAGTSEAAARTQTLNPLAYKKAYVHGTAGANGATLGVAANVTRHMHSARLESEAVASTFYPKVTITVDPIALEGHAKTEADYRNAAVHMDTSAIEISALISLPWAPDDADIGARPLRFIRIESVVPAIAEGGASRNVFKINADDPAPDWRVINVPFTDRSHLIMAEPREYVIQ